MFLKFLKEELLKALAILIIALAILVPRATKSGKSEIRESYRTAPTNKGCDQISRSR